LCGSPEELGDRRVTGLLSVIGIQVVLCVGERLAANLTGAITVHRVQEVGEGLPRAGWGTAGDGHRDYHLWSRNLDIWVAQGPQRRRVSGGVPGLVVGDLGEQGSGFRAAISLCLGSETRVHGLPLVGLPGDRVRQIGPVAADQTG